MAQPPPAVLCSSSPLGPSPIALLNAEVRCISRVIVHPSFRGLGIGVGLVRHALDTATTPYTEAIAAMGWVHPLFEKAGMEAFWPEGEEGKVYYLKKNFNVQRPTLNFQHPTCHRSTHGTP